MSHIRPVDPATAAPAVAQTLAAVKARIGMVPNLFATFAQAPAVLDAYLKFSDALASGRLTARQREIIALAVGQANACQYCLSAHTLMARGAGLDADAVDRARRGEAEDALDNALAGFARQLATERGRASAADLDALRRAGVDDGLILEVIAQVALNTLTNYTNHVAATDIDFPLVSL